VVPVVHVVLDEVADVHVLQPGDPRHLLQPRRPRHPDTGPRGGSMGGLGVSEPPDRRQLMGDKNRNTESIVNLGSFVEPVSRIHRHRWGGGEG